MDPGAGADAGESSQWLVAGMYRSMNPGLVLLGVGAMNSPRYRPAGLLVTWAVGALIRHRAKASYS